jgi:1-acyl-sn-glycerol-3-phosphate acyltransferase
MLEEHQVRGERGGRGHARLVTAVDRDPSVIAVATRAARQAIELATHRAVYTATPMAEGSFPLALLAVAETLRISAPTALEAALGRLTRQAVDRRLAAWSSRLMREAAVDLDVEGLDHVRDRDETFVLMSNHQSHFDVPVLYATFPRCMRMVAKTELYKIPVFGRALRGAEMIEVDRANPERSRASIALAKDTLRSGVNVWIAPEGTRSTTGKLASFKKGGFILALDTRTRILPITIDGTRPALGAAAPKLGEHNESHGVPPLA